MISALGQCGGPKAASLISITARSEPYSADKAWGQKAFSLGGNQSSTFPRINLTACLTSVFRRLCPDMSQQGGFSLNVSVMPMSYTLKVPSDREKEVHWRCKVSDADYPHMGK